jgi:hypothetical protein
VFTNLIHLAVKPASRTNDRCQLTLYHSLDERIIANALIEVPWNNNNAEHAIKAFARLHSIIGGKTQRNAGIPHLAEHQRNVQEQGHQLS